MTFVLAMFCLNVVVLSIFGSYDFRCGTIHLQAHGLFKPLLMMNSCFLLVLLLCGSSVQKNIDPNPHGTQESSVLSARYHALLSVLISLLVLAIYCTSVQINFSHHDWTHRHISAGIDSLQAAWQLFKNRQADGFYRPLTFVSLWIDFRLFGTWYPGYHIQNIALHIINSLLVAWMAIELGFDRRSALWAGLLFSVAAVNFEPVLWPAARFDLLATVFTLTALILAIRYFRTAAVWAWILPVSSLCFALGILNKESSYCLPLLVSFIVCTHQTWSIPRPNWRKLFLYLLLALSIAAAMILIRIEVYGNLGGYPTSAVSKSPHFAVAWKTFISLLRILPLSIFGVNTTSAAPVWLPALLIIYSLLVLVTSVACRDCFRRRELSLVACAFLASIPVLNITGWIGPSIQHSRYLYMPGIFSMLLIVSLLQKVRRSGIFLGIYLLVNAAGALANIWCYRDMLARTESISESVHRDWIRQPDAKTIYLMNLPENPNGVFYFGSELVEKIEKKIPAATVIRLEGHLPPVSETQAIVYQWSNANRMLVDAQK